MCRQKTDLDWVRKPGWVLHLPRWELWPAVSRCGAQCPACLAPRFPAITEIRREKRSSCELVRAVEQTLQAALRSREVPTALGPPQTGDTSRPAAVRAEFKGTEWSCH